MTGPAFNEGGGGDCGRVRAHEGEKSEQWVGCGGDGAGRGAAGRSCGLQQVRCNATTTRAPVAASSLNFFHAPVEGTFPNCREVMPDLSATKLKPRVVLNAVILRRILDTMIRAVKPTGGDICAVDIQLAGPTRPVTLRAHTADGQHIPAAISTVIEDHHADEPPIAEDPRSDWERG